MSRPGVGVDFETSKHAHQPIEMGNTSETISLSIEGDAGKDVSSSPPDGGATAWLVVMGAWCIAFCSFGWLNSVGTFQDYYQRTMLSQYSASEISWIPSLQIFFMFGMGPIVGKIYDSYGPRYLLLVGSFMHVLGLMMASISSSYYQIMLSQGICSAIGVSCIFQPALSSVAGWFNEKRGFAFGVLSTGSSIGGVVFPIMVSRLIRELNYGWAMRISAFLIMGLLVIANMTVRARLPPNPYKPTGGEFTRPFREIPVLGIFFGNFLLTFAIFTPVTYVVVEAAANGMSPNLTQYLLAILNAASLFGRLGSGILADKIGRFNVFIIVCFAAGILMLALWIPASDNASIIVFTALFGFFSGAYVSLPPALIAQLSPPKEAGLRQGLLFFIASISGLTTGPIAGAILESQNGSFTGMKIYAGALCIAGSTVLLAARVRTVGWGLFTKY